MIYFIRMCGTNYVKVGKTANVAARLGSLACGNPIPLEVVHVINIETSKWDHDPFEKAIHEALDSKRVRGEWFELSPELLERVVRKFDPKWNHYQHYKDAVL